MICTVIKAFTYARKNYSRGDTPNLTSATCRDLAAQGLVSLSGLPEENPHQTDGADSMSSASPAVQVSPQTTYPESESGDSPVSEELTPKERRRRKRFAEEES